MATGGNSDLCPHQKRQTFEDDKVAFLKEQFLDSSVFNNTTECELLLL